jgi:pyrimidine 5'-nucleotidase
MFHNIQTTYLIFDVDETLYRRSHGVIKYMNSKRDKYLPLKNIYISKKTLQNLYLKYGSTIKGLNEEFNYKLNMISFLDFISEGATKLIKISREESINLIKILSKFKKYENIKLWIFTNGCKKHAFSVLKHLNITEYFDGFIHVNLLNDIERYLCKPNKKAYQWVEKIIGFDKERDKIIFFEDNEKNIKVAHTMGWKCVYVNEDDKKLKGSFTINNILEIDKALKNLI